MADTQKLNEVISYLKTQGLDVIETQDVANSRNLIKANEEKDDKPLYEKMVYPRDEVQSEGLSNGRWYHAIGDTNVNNWKPSVTTVLSVIDKGSGFNAWNRNYSHMADPYMKYAAIKGSITHYSIDDLVNGKTVTAQDIWNMIEAESDESWKVFGSKKNMAQQVMRNIESFMAFWEECDPIPIAAEYPILTDLYGGRLDLIVQIKKTKNSKKRSTVMIDIKTGGSYFSHALQNSAYKNAWDNEHPDIPIDYIAGLYVTSEYRDRPTYKLKYQNYMYDEFLQALKLWHAINKPVKADAVKPKLNKKTRTVFSLYNEKEKEA